MRFIADSTPDTKFLIDWHREHGRAWPEPHEALPPIVQAKLVEYMEIISVTRDNVGQAVGARTNCWHGMPTGSRRWASSATTSTT